MTGIDRQPGAAAPADLLLDPQALPGEVVQRLGLRPRMKWSGHTNSEATNNFALSKEVLNGGMPGFLGYRVGRSEDDKEQLFRYGVTGGNLRGAAPEVYAAISEFVAAPENMRSGIYMQFTQRPELIAAIGDYFTKLGIPFYKNSIAVGSGTTNLIMAIISSVMEKGCGDVVLHTVPYYHSVLPIPQYFGGFSEAVQTEKTNGHKLTPADINAWYNAENASADRPRRVKAIIVYNPTLAGDNYTQAELDAILQNLVDRHASAGVPVPLIIEDSVYANINLDHENPSRFASMAGAVATYPDTAAHDTNGHSLARRKVSGLDYTAILNGVPKAQCAPELRIGFAALPSANLLTAVRKFVTFSTTEVPVLSQVAAEAALARTPDEFYRRNEREYARRVDHVENLLAQMNANLRNYFDGKIAGDKILREIFSASGALDANSGAISPAHEFVSLYHRPSKGNILYLDFKGCSGLSAADLAGGKDSPMRNVSGQPLASSLHISRAFMDSNTDGHNGEQKAGNGVALSAGVAMGFFKNPEQRFICKFQIAQTGHELTIGKTGRELDQAFDQALKIFDDVFLNRIAGGVIELIENQECYRNICPLNHLARKFSMGNVPLPTKSKIHALG